MTRAIFCLAILACSVEAIDIEAFKTVEVNGKCLYASVYKLWPYQNNDMTINHARSACDEIGLELAKMESNDENSALKQLIRCYMKDAIGTEDDILIDFGTSFNPSGLSAGSNCYFQNPDGSHSSSNNDNCQDWFKDSNGMVTKQVNFACKKHAPCNALPGCEYRGGQTDKCYYDLGQTTHAGAVSQCKAKKGYLPRMTTQAERDALPEYTWVGLTSKAPSLTNCDGVSICIATGKNFFWDGNGVVPDLPLNINQNPFMKGLQLDQNSPCNRYRWDIVRDATCSINNQAFCVLPLNGQGVSASITQPDYTFNSMVCGTPDAPPLASKMQLNSSQPDIMCPGTKARYVCNAGGVNIREDVPSKSSLDVTCGNNLQYTYPNPWPVCTDRVDCPAPDLDDTIMKHDWTAATGYRPEFSVTYTCLWPNKKIVSKKDLSLNIASNLHDSLVLHCQLDGTYDDDILSYACTRPCPFPSLPEPDLMAHDWPLNDTKPEIFQEVKHNCLNGRHLVRKDAFKTGAPTPLLSEVMSSCQLSGWLNESIGSYTCSRGCDPPLNYSEIFTFDWNPTKGSDIGTIVKYTCLNPTKFVVNLVEEDTQLHAIFATTCLYNGQYDDNIENYGCTECTRRPDPQNGKIVCESKRYQEGKACVLQCDSGYIPLSKSYMLCKFDDKLHDYVWSVDESQFRCVDPIAYAVGGQSQDLRYQSSIEIVAPGYNCSQAEVADYPLKIYGAVAAFIDGQTIVCGGAVEQYIDCSLHTERSILCEKNVECIETKGGSRWCTGPKTDACYTYDPILTKDWSLAIKLKSARAHAASTVSLDGTFWVLGGAGSTEILKSSEKLTYHSEVWKNKPGVSLPLPLIGACAAPLNIQEIVVLGGFTSLTYDFIEEVHILNVATNTWYKKPWAKLYGGPGFDISCSLVRWSMKTFVLVAGGWNNTANMDTALFDTTALKFSPVMKKETTTTRRPLSFQLRSAAMTELNKKPTLVGGVTCSGKDKQRQICERTGKVFQLTMTEGTLFTNGTDAYWKEDSENRMNIARSGHALVSVPKDFAPKCKRNTVVPPA